MKVYSDPKITSSILVSIFLIAGISGRPAPEPWEPYSEMDFDTAFKGAKGFGELGWGGVQMAVVSYLLEIVTQLQFSVK